MKILRFLKNYKKESLLAPLFKMMEAIFDLLVPLVVARIIDDGIRRGDTTDVLQMGGLRQKQQQDLVKNLDIHCLIIYKNFRTLSLTIREHQHL